MLAGTRSLNLFSRFTRHLFLFYSLGFIKLYAREAHPRGWSVTNTSLRGFWKNLDQFTRRDFSVASASIFRSTRASGVLQHADSNVCSINREQHLNMRKRPAQRLSFGQLRHSLWRITHIRHFERQVLPFCYKAARLQGLRVGSVSTAYICNTYPIDEINEITWLIFYWMGTIVWNNFCHLLPVLSFKEESKCLSCVVVFFVAYSTY